MSNVAVLMDFMVFLGRNENVLLLWIKQPVSMRASERFDVWKNRSIETEDAGVTSPIKTKAQTNRQTDRRSCRQTTQADRLTDRQTDRQVRQGLTLMRPWTAVMGMM